MTARAAVTLADGRPASAVLVVPLVARGAVGGVLIAMRAGRSFGDSDALAAWHICELATLELARSLAAHDDDAHRRQALLLYELARLALFGEDLRETLHTAVEIIASTLDHETVQLWLLRAGGSLQLRAAHPDDGLPLRIVRPRDLEGVSEALHQR